MGLQHLLRLLQPAGVAADDQAVQARPLQLRGRTGEKSAATVAAALLAEAAVAGLSTLATVHPLIQWAPLSYARPAACIYCCEASELGELPT